MYTASLVVTVAVDGTVLWFVLPAYSRTRHVGFLLIAIASAVGIAGTIWDHTVGQRSMDDGQLATYTTLRYLRYFIDSVLYGIGMIALTRTFLRRFDRSLPTQG